MQKIEPMQKPVSGKAKTGIALAAMVAIVTPTIALWEGKSNDPYRDLIGVYTVCYGETRVEMRRYTNAECTAMLEEAVGEFGMNVLKRNPDLVNRPHQWAAATSLAYNIGPAAYNRSTVARRFDSGLWMEGCEAFAMWNKAGGKTRKGLVNRRADEMRLCKTGLQQRFGFTTQIAHELQQGKY